MKSADSGRWRRWPTSTSSRSRFPARSARSPTTGGRRTRRRQGVCVPPLPTQGRGRRGDGRAPRRRAHVPRRRPRREGDPPLRRPRHLLHDAALHGTTRRCSSGSPTSRRLDRDELDDLVVDAWLTRAQKRVAKAWLAEHEARRLARVPVTAARLALVVLGACLARSLPRRSGGAAHDARAPTSSRGRSPSRPREARDAGLREAPLRARHLAAAQPEGDRRAHHRLEHVRLGVRDLQRRRRRLRAARAARAPAPTS